MVQRSAVGKKAGVNMEFGKLYVTCPVCGRRLCRAVPGSEVDTECPKCQSTVLIRIDKEGAVITRIMETKLARA